MKIEELIANLPWIGLEEALQYGFSEAEALGKNFIGITLDNGDGLILYVNPFLNDVYKILLMSKSRYNLPSIGVFSNFNGDKYFIYDVGDISELINILGSNLKVIYVEVIKNVLEDFLYQTVVR
ncbi:hypothetical protein J5U23_02519 [Saccharolobus shibatae B12]|uniref:Uncharacterized protein n=1 Tax=Saccharolobus shibatae (strain ATCC 51178 / DSM 5389 / JCM 8931 / NBRC 15437 / B12) TaxID=523848 RepID=A0A8F5BQK0_SACSH|nr:hypothetical protein [Saccharolobus shibatae]QXJ29646.1 hypothetical protein J5U23_02519 [Saccharolobus shibatae B12]